MDTKLLSELQQIYNSYDSTDINHVIASYLLEHIFEFDKITINEVSEACFTSNATISRFVRSIGCENFQAMKHGLVSGYSRIAKELMIDNKQDLHFNKGDDHKELQEYVDIISDGLIGMADSINFDEIDQFIDKIHDYENVYFCGTQLPGLLCNYLQFMLFNCKKITHAVWTLEQHERMFKEIKGKEEKSMVIIFSLNGNYTRIYNNEIISLIDSNIHTVLITQDPNLKRIRDFDSYIILGETTNSKIGRYKLQLFIEMVINRYYNKYQQGLLK